MRNIIQESVCFLFNELEKKRILIVVLRNYQSLPDIGSDLDAAINKQNIIEVREVLTSDFFRSRWTEVCEVKTHNSPIDEQNIFIFKFFNQELNEYMQLDFFQGFLLKGQPFIKIQDMLLDKRLVHGFPVVSVDVELKIKYFQILSALSSNQKDRVQKYSDQAIEMQNLWSYNADFDYALFNNFIVKKEYQSFFKTLKSYRRDFLIKLFVKKPFYFIKNILFRFRSLYKFFINDPFVVKCYLSNSIDKKTVNDILNLLVAKKCFRGYYIKENETFINRLKKFKYLAQGGGIIISFTPSGYYSDIDDDIKNEIIQTFVKNHTNIY